jgi:hypothetical protein
LSVDGAVTAGASVGSVLVLTIECPALAQLIGFFLLHYNSPHWTSSVQALADAMVCLARISPVTMTYRYFGQQRPLAQA